MRRIWVWCLRALTGSGDLHLLPIALANMPNWFWHSVSLTSFGKEQYWALGNVEVLGVCNQKELWNWAHQSLGSASHTQYMQLTSSFSSNPELWPQSRHVNVFKPILDSRPWGFPLPLKWVPGQCGRENLGRRGSMAGSCSALSLKLKQKLNYHNTICTSQKQLGDAWMRLFAHPPCGPTPGVRGVWASKELPAWSGWQKSAECRRWHLVTREFRAHKETLSEETLYPAVPSGPPHELHGLLLH